jgi:O-antigen/teichoic acid export membrane protein
MSRAVLPTDEGARVRVTGQSGWFGALRAAVRHYRAQAQSATFRSIIANTASLGGTTIVTAGLGYLFWILAARQLPAAAVGFAGASISAMTLLGTASLLGFGTLLIGELPKHRGREGALVMLGVTISGTVGMTLGSLFAAIAPSLSQELALLGADIGRILLFGLGVGLTSATMVLDQALIGLSRGALQLLRNAVFAAAKLGLLVLASTWMLGADGMTVYGSWVAGNIVSLVGIVAMLGWAHRTRTGTAGQAAPSQAGTFAPSRGSRLRGLGRAALSHHALNLALQAPFLLLPLIATTFLSATTNAYFYIAWVLSGFVFIGPGHLATALYAAAARTPTALAGKVRFTLGLGLLVSVCAIVAIYAAGGFVLGMFGDAYADEALACLRVLVFWSLPLIVKDHYVVLRRLQGRSGSAALVVATAGVLEVVLAAFGAATGGLLGLSLGWLLAGWLQATVMVPTVYRALMGQPLIGQAGAATGTAGLRGEAAR